MSKEGGRKGREKGKEGITSLIWFMETGAWEMKPKSTSLCEPGTRWSRERSLWVGDDQTG